MSGDSFDPDSSFFSGNYTYRDLERWVATCKRFNVFSATIVQYQGRVCLRVQETADSNGWIVGTYDRWKAFTDQKFYFLEPRTIHWDDFHPRHAKYKENEIHKWIGKYKDIE